MKRSLLSLLILLNTITPIHAEDVITVNVSEPGSFFEDLQQIVEDPKTVTGLKVTGDINSSDVRKIRMMAKGKEFSKYYTVHHYEPYLGYFDDSDKYNLEYLDLSDANIVGGKTANQDPYFKEAIPDDDYTIYGVPMSGSWTTKNLYTEKDNLSSNLLAWLYGLQTIITPKSVTSFDVNSLDTGIPTCIVNGNFKILPNRFLTAKQIKPSSSLSKYKADNKIKELQLPESIEIIGDSIAQDCNGIQNLTIPSNVWYIGKDSFTNSQAYLSQKVLKRLRYIGENTFNSVTLDNETVSMDSVVAIKSFSSPSAPTTTLNLTFTRENNSNLTEYIDQLKESDFTICNVALPNLETINLKIDKPETDGDVIKLPQMTNCAKLKTINADAQTYIAVGKYAFANCNGITHIENVCDVSKRAFVNCKSLEYISFKPHVKLKDSYFSSSFFADCFSGCSNLQNYGGAELDLNVDGLAVKDGALYNVSQGKAQLIAYPRGRSSEQLTWTSDYDDAYEYAFDECNNITSINVVSGHLPDNLMLSFPNLKSVTVEPTSDYLDIDGNIYEKGAAEGEIGKLVLHTTGMPDTLKLPLDFNAKIYIGTYPNLRKVTIPWNYSNMDGLFPNAAGLDTLIFESKTPPEISSSWTDITLKTMRYRRGHTTLYVPFDCLSEYRNDNFWCWFKDYFKESDYTSVSTIKTDNITIKADGLDIEVEGIADGTAVKIFSTDGRKIYEGSDHRIQMPARGIYIVKTDSTVNKIIVR